MSKEFLHFGTVEKKQVLYNTNLYWQRLAHTVGFSKSQTDVFVTLSPVYAIVRPHLHLGTKTSTRNSVESGFTTSF